MGGDNELVTGLRIFAPQGVVENEKLHTISNKRLVVFVRHVTGTLEVSVPDMYQVDTIIGETSGI
jgi:hypothetical protein